MGLSISIVSRPYPDDRLASSGGFAPPLRVSTPIGAALTVAPAGCGGEHCREEPERRPLSLPSRHHPRARPLVGGPVVGRPQGVLAGEMRLSDSQGRFHQGNVAGTTSRRERVVTTLRPSSAKNARPGGRNAHLGSLERRIHRRTDGAGDRVDCPKRLRRRLRWDPTVHPPPPFLLVQARGTRTVVLLAQRQAERDKIGARQSALTRGIMRAMEDERWAIKREDRRIEGAAAANTA